MWKKAEQMCYDPSVCWVKVILIGITHGIPWAEQGWRKPICLLKSAVTKCPCNTWAMRTGCSFWAGKLLTWARIMQRAVCLCMDMIEGGRGQRGGGCMIAWTQAHKRKTRIALRFVVIFPHTAICVHILCPHFLLTHRSPNGLLVHDSFSLVFWFLHLFSLSFQIRMCQAFSFALFPRAYLPLLDFVNSCFTRRALHMAKSNLPQPFIQTSSNEPCFHLLLITC